MSEYNDIAGSDDIISLNYESQETFNEQSYRNKQSASRIEKILPIKGQAKENQNPVEQDDVEVIDPMQTDTQNYSLPPVTNEVSTEQAPLSIDTQDTLTSNNPIIIRPPVAQSTLTDESSISADKDSLSVKSPIQDEKNTLTESTSKIKVNAHVSGLDASTTANNLRLYISPSTSLLETTNVDDAQPKPENTSATGKNQETDLNNKPKEEPMDTSDAQASLGSDGMIEPNPGSALIIESESVMATEKSTTGQSPIQSKSTISPALKAHYSLSQPTTDKFEAILAKFITSPSRRVLSNSSDGNKSDSNMIIREEEELFIKESISKTIRRYTVIVDPNGRTVSRELLNERIVEENITSRVESWPHSEKKPRRPVVKATRPSENARKKITKPASPKRRTRSLRPTSTAAASKISKAVRSDDDEESKSNTNETTSDDDEDEEEEDEDDKATDDVSGDEFIPPSTSSSGRGLKNGSRVFAKWVDGHYYPGVIGSVSGEKYMIDFDDGAKRYVKTTEMISQSYLPADQDVMAQTQDGYFDRGIIKRLIKKKKSGNLGYVIEKDGKEKWYPLRFISLTTEQAELLPVVKDNTKELTTTVQGKRKRTSVLPLSPNKKTKSSVIVSPNNKKTKSSVVVSPNNKKTKSSVVVSPNKNQRSTPTRQAKLFGTMCFLLSGFNDIMDVREKIQDSIESHGGKVTEKMPNNNRRDHVYVISDVARRTAKFFEAKKLNIPTVNYKWIDESVEKGELQDWETYKLVLPEKETKPTNDVVEMENED